MSGDQFLALVSGNSSPTMMFLTGKVTVDGDVMFAATLSNIFELPQA
jgi:putative sterol carrier protein